MKSYSGNSVGVAGMVAHAIILILRRLRWEHHELEGSLDSIM